MNPKTRKLITDTVGQQDPKTQLVWLLLSETIGKDLKEAARVVGTPCVLGWLKLHVDAFASEVQSNQGGTK